MTITGKSKSRLSELKKYTVSSDFFNRYFLSSSRANDGVNKTKSNISTIPQKIIYYLGGITYIDYIYSDDNIKTVFSFEGQGYNSPDFRNNPIIKDPSKSNLVSNPKVDSDVFIVRQEISAFDKNYKLKNIKSLIELTTYAGGKFFNIVNNT